MDLPHSPIGLFQASTERKEAAWAALDRRDYVLAIYLGGLAVECILQAIAFLDDRTHDAGHDLPKWLARCRTSMLEAAKSPEIRDDWSYLVRVWNNSLRYLSLAGLIGHLRKQELNRGMKGGSADIMKKVAERFLHGASRVHTLGVAKWAHYTKK